MRTNAAMGRDVIGEGEAFHRSSPDGNRGEKADLHSPARSRSSHREKHADQKVGDCCESRNTPLDAFRDDGIR